MISELTDDNLGLERCCSLWFWVELLSCETIFEIFIISLSFAHLIIHHTTSHYQSKSFLTSKTDTQSARLGGVRLKRVDFTFFSSSKCILLQPFEPLKEILCLDHSNETSSAVFSHSTIHLVAKM